VYGDDYWSERNYQLDKVDLAFTVIFILECASKIIAKGFIFHKNSYLRDIWNWLDFFVVCVSLLNFLPGIDSGGLKALRTFRILRPLRTINRMPQMKQLILTLFASLPGLFGVVIFLGFTFLLFAIFGIQSFAGDQYNFCRVTEAPEITYNSAGELESYSWPIVSTFPWLCVSDTDCKTLIETFGADPESVGEPVYKCGRSIDYGIKAGGPMNIDDVRNNEHILFDIVNFNNIANAMLTIFQVLSLENWTDGMMYNYMDASNYYISAVYFVLLVIFGSFFILNLVLAQIVESYDI
jgi:Ion transport protein